MNDRTVNRDSYSLRRLIIIEQFLLSQCNTIIFFKGDSEKIVAAYSDGTVRVWDVLTRHNRYDLKGRSPYISCVQYDATRYART